MCSGTHTPAPPTLPSLHPHSKLITEVVDSFTLNGLLMGPLSEIWSECKISCYRHVNRRSGWSPPPWAPLPPPPPHRLPNWRVGSRGRPGHPTMGTTYAECCKTRQRKGPERENRYADPGCDVPGQADQGGGDSISSARYGHFTPARVVGSVRHNTMYPEAPTSLAPSW
jgi:hypothetical protein